MKKIFLILFVLALVPVLSPIKNNTNHVGSAAAITFGIDCAEAKAECCTDHDGVCGCSGNDVLCCDGTISPTCTCSNF